MSTTAGTHRIPALAKIVGLLLVSAILVAAAVLPQLTARLTGQDYQLRVAPLDPIDPFRGAYVALNYPDIQQRNPDGSMTDPLSDDKRGDIFVTLVRDGEVWKASSFSRERPDSSPYLTCNDRNFSIDCGIDSWFLPQDKAKALEDAVRGGTAVATIRIDSRGNAALVDVLPTR